MDDDSIGYILYHFIPRLLSRPCRNGKKERKKESFDKFQTETWNNKELVERC